jgi:hypothetical protein
MTAMSTVDFKPSDVDIFGMPPLLDTMGRSQREFSAALYVRACQFHGDSWQPMEPRRIGEMLKADLAAEREPVRTWNGNPFLRTDFLDLVEKGFARWVHEEGGAVMLTDAGMSALSRWVPRSSP